MKDAFQSEVTITEKQMVIPTYEVEAADPNPYFFDGRRYQGASGRVYPYPMVDNFTDNLIDKSYTVLILENEFIEVCVIPELGGKMYYAKDKTNDYFFMYRNQVVKPALIGMTGAWTSGGVEWNVPHHHRPTTFSMVDYKVEEGADGSKTVWVGEVELRDYMKWTVGVTIYPGKAYVEATIRVMNTTPRKNSMLFWANGSTHVNKDYQIIFPPRTQYATFHKKNEFSEWPISRQIYTGGDFRHGVDVSKWKNQSISTSFFAWETQSNFVGGYDHGKKAGSVIFGDPHTNTGAKLWSWGDNEYGNLWNNILTDEDGPYVELMFGAFSDNQPDYAWLHPYETKESKMYFMPSRNIPSMKKVSQQGIIDFEMEEGNATIGVYAAARFENAEVILKRGDEVVHQENATILPDKTYSKTVKANELSGEYFTVVVLSETGETLMEYTHLPKQDGPMPKGVEAPASPEELTTADNIHYTGLRLEQFHEPQLDPMDYYFKALEKDADHLLSNLRIGINFFKRRMYDEADKYISKVVARTTWDYTTAENAEGIYYAGLIQLSKGNLEEAYKLLYKSTWDYQWSSPAHYQMALIKLKSCDLQKALFHLNESLSTNQRNLDALSTKLSLLRTLGQTEEAKQLAASILALHPLNLRAVYEQTKLHGEAVSEATFGGKAASGLHAYLDLATKYGEDSFYAEALEILALCANSENKEFNANPIVYYLSAYYGAKLGKETESMTNLEKATSFTVDGCFPSRIETQKALEWALDKEENAKTLFYLGNLLCEKQPEVSIALWEKSLAKDSSIAMTNRNLAFTYSNAKKDFQKASKHIKQAIEKSAKDPLYFTEQDLYLSKLNAPIAERLALMEANKEVVLSINHSASAYLKLLVLDYKYDEALELMEVHHFRTWEGDEKRAYEYWVYVHLVKAAKAIKANDLDAAKVILEETLSRPTNIDVPIHDLDLIVNYFQALVAEKQGQKTEAKALFTKATDGESKSNDIKLFAGIAHQKLGNQEKADEIFNALIEKGYQLLKEKEKPDFFDPFSREISDAENASNANYLLALGKYGKGEKEEAEKFAKDAVALNNTLVAITFRLEITE